MSVHKNLDDDMWLVFVVGQYIHFREYRLIGLSHEFFVSVSSLCTFTTDTTCELNVLGHNGHTLGVNGAQVCIFEETDQVSLGSFLKKRFLFFFVHRVIFLFFTKKNELIK